MSTLLELQETATTRFNVWVRSCRKVFSKYAIKDKHSDYLIKQYRRTVAAINQQVVLFDTVCGAERDEVRENLEYLQRDGVTRYLDLVCYLGDKFAWLGIDDSGQRERVDSLNDALHAIGAELMNSYPDYPVPDYATVIRVRDLRLHAPAEVHANEWK